ncbi:hypothetical protein XENTR_v10014798 [Xenopus tropicalis]|nr:hypothetical protein XENTR_v10014798 [Xenopus tropicalis]
MSQCSYSVSKDTEVRLPLGCLSSVISFLALEEERRVQRRETILNAINMSDLIPPKNILFPPEKIFLNWQNMCDIGAGLRNLGNTCYMNSVLQCLTYTAPLANYFLTCEHSKRCVKKGFCMMCLMQKHIAQVKSVSGRGAIKPVEVYNALNRIAGHFKQGRQEDAHEFLRYAVDALQQACLTGYDSLDRTTTFIHQVFGGYLRSEVRCLNCSGVSDTFDQFLDLQLDIKKANSVIEALKEYVRPENLGESCYKCSKCNEMVTATKTFSIHQPPNVLTLCLNRFDVFSENKISKMVTYPEFIDIHPYTSEKSEGTINYRLYAVLVHAGNTCNSGHYYCYVQAPNSKWYKMNDDCVTPVDINTVLKLEAYLLFYIRSNRIPTNLIPATPKHQQPPMRQPAGSGTAPMKKETEERKRKAFKRPIPTEANPTETSSLQEPMDRKPAAKKFKLDRSFLYKVISHLSNNQLVKKATNVFGFYL